MEKGPARKTFLALPAEETSIRRMRRLRSGLFAKVFLGGSLLHPNKRFVEHSFLVEFYCVNLSGDYCRGVIPVPISNTEVKPSRADDTASLRGGKVGRCQAFF